MRRQQGFTYLGLIILLAIIGMVGAAGLKVGSLLQRAAAEEELLEIGAAFSAALKSYADATPRGQPTQPKTLQDLLRDPRFPGARRHLRKIFVDPLTGKAEWGVIYLGDKVGVVGVHSLSNAKPLKVSNFDTRFTNLDNKKKISEWKFMLPGQMLLAPGMMPGGMGSMFKPGSLGPPRQLANQPPNQPPTQPPAPAEPVEAPPPREEPPPAPPVEEKAPEKVEEEEKPDEKPEEKAEDKVEERPDPGAPVI